MPSGEATERIFQSKVEQLAVMNQWLVFHPTPHQVRPGVFRSDGKGFVDLVLAHRERGVIFAELKLEGGKLSPMQVVWANALKPHVEHYVWRPNMLELIAERLGRK
jgi:hypothetical protein